MGNDASHQIKYGEPLENDIEVTWTKNGSNCPFPPRDGHVACNVGNKMFVFGGVVRTDDGQNLESNELLVFDLGDQSWSVVTTKGSVPEARSSAGMAAVENKLYLFGGLSQNSGWFEDVYSYDIESSTWTKVEASGPGPSPRDKLAAAAIGDKIFCFGGFGPKMPEEELVEEFSTEDEEEMDEGITSQQDGAEFGWFNDIHVFDPATSTWENPMQLNAGAPTPRAAMGMCPVEKYLVIFGGRDTEGRKNDIHIYNTESRKWDTSLAVGVKGRQPEPRSFHTATAVGKRVVVFGGRGLDNSHYNQLHIFDTDAKIWLQPSIQGDVPEARGVHTAVVVGDNLVLFGGSGNFNSESMQCNSYYNDVHTIKTADILSGQCTAKPDQENIASASNIPAASGDAPLKPVSKVEAAEAAPQSS